MTDSNDNALRVAHLNASVARAMIKALGMQAENMRRAAMGDSIAYKEIDFLNLIEEEGISPDGVAPF